MDGWTGGCVDEREKERENKRERSGVSWFEIKREILNLLKNLIFIYKALIKLVKIDESKNIA